MFGAPCAFSDHSSVAIALVIKNAVKKSPYFTADLEDLCNQCIHAESKDRSNGKIVKFALNNCLYAGMSDGTKLS